MLLFKDISYAQGLYNMDANSDPMVMIKFSGGDAGLYYDSQAARNYNNAIRTGKVPFAYHFYGGGDPVAEANHFIKGCQPLAEGDGMALDVESGDTWNPQADPGAVAKVTAFVNHVHDVTGVWMWVYMNISTANMYDWSPVFNNCAYWCAAPSYGFDDNIPVKYPQTAQQGPIVNGVDTDAVFVNDVAQLKKFCYHQSPEPSPTPVPVPVPDPPPIIPPAPAPIPEPVPAPEPTPTPPPVPTPEPTPEPTPPASTNWKLIIGAIVAAVAALIVAVQHWLK